jgi:molecular chaperone Hsp33
LFHEEDVRLFDVDDIRFQCSCSQGKVDAMVMSIGQNDAEDMIEKQGEIAIDCEFCNRHYQLDKIDVQRLFSESAVDSNDTVH